MKPLVPMAGQHLCRSREGDKCGGGGGVFVVLAFVTIDVNGNVLGFMLWGMNLPCLRHAIGCCFRNTFMVDHTLGALAVFKQSFRVPIVAQN